MGGFPKTLNFVSPPSGDIGGTSATPTVQSLHGLGAVAQPTAYTNSSAYPASKTLAATTAVAAAATAATLVTPAGYTTTAQADSIRAAVNALIADVGNLQKTVGQLIADLKTEGVTA